jgi:hypothetical protein
VKFSIHGCAYSTDSLPAKYFPVFERGNCTSTSETLWVGMIVSVSVSAGSSVGGLVVTSDVFDGVGAMIIGTDPAGGVVEHDTNHEPIKTAAKMYRTILPLLVNILPPLQ